MNFSILNVKKFFPLLTIVLAQMVFGLPPGVCLRAQVATQTPPASTASTLQERMQKSLSRQMNSIAAMQRSIGAQQQAVLHQNGDVAGQGFFTLPAPARIPSSLLESPRETGDEDGESGEDSAQPQSLDEAAPPPREVHTGSTGGGGARVEVPWIDALPLPLVGIGDTPPVAPAPIAGIAGPGISNAGPGVAWDLSLEGFLMRQFANNQPGADAPPLMEVPEPVPGQDGKENGNASGHNPLPRGAGAVDYLRQMLDLNIGGSSLFEGFTGAR